MDIILATIELSLNNIIAIILTIASLITAITVIVHFLKKSNSAVNARIRAEAKEVAEEEALVERELREKDIKRIEQMLDMRFESLEEKIDTLIKNAETQAKKQDTMNTLLQEGHKETWKNDIRTIYYNLRDTGNITDIEKSYVDKIYHLYKAMGGNSDIDAKYAEMTTAYTKRLEESLDEAFEKTKKTGKSGRQ